VHSGGKPDSGCGGHMVQGAMGELSPVARGVAEMGGGGDAHRDLGASPEHGTSRGRRFGWTG
jgi:hypothetical protein